MTMIMRGSSMYNAEDDLKAIMYHAYGTHHWLHIIRENKIYLTKDLSE